eukprot:COSAG02_NODE_9403_length_2228_cov_1.620949_1_plen_162_part_01
MLDLDAITYRARGFAKRRARGGRATESNGGALASVPVHAYDTRPRFIGPYCSNKSNADALEFTGTVAAGPVVARASSLVVAGARGVGGHHPVRRQSVSMAKGRSRRAKRTQLLKDSWFSPELEAALAQVFARFDVDGDGLLSVSELQAYSRAVNNGEELGAD